MAIKLFSFLVCLIYLKTVSSNEEFHETANIEFMDRNLLQTYLNFTTVTSFKDFNSNHYSLFPRSIGQILKRYKVSEIHFTITRGFWRHNIWTKPFSSAPAGTQVWVKFKKGSSNVDKLWKGLLNALSGIFCTSLEQISLDMAVQTRLNFFSENDIIEENFPFIRYASVVKENLCTENLTPWLKQLPCFTNFGIASLINFKYLHSSHYLSMGFHFNSKCVDNHCKNLDVYIRQDLTTVLDVQSNDLNLNSFSLKSTFGKTLKPPCSLATTSHIIILKNNQMLSYPTSSNQDEFVFSFNLKKDTPKDIVIQNIYNVAKPSNSQRQSDIFNHCFLIEKYSFGRLYCSISNLKKDQISISFLQIFPWFLYLKFHTLFLSNDKNMEVEPEFTKFIPGQFRKSAHILEIMMTLPPNSTTSVYLDFDKGFLKWTEYPPDANHGFYISPSVLIVNSINQTLLTNSEKQDMKIFSEPLLVNIPVPDFSMPYNVICFVCTVIALGFGYIFNLSSKKLGYASSKISNIKLSIKCLLNRFKKS